MILEDPVADNTDVFAFVSPDKPHMTTLISNWIPLEEPAAGPNYYKFGEDVLYEINVDNNGDAIDDIVYQFRFRTQIMNGNAPVAFTGRITSLDDPDYNLRQTYTMTEVRNGRRRVLGRNLPVPPPNVGPRATPNYNRLARMAYNKVGNGMTVFAGQREDPFYVDVGSLGDVGGLRPFNTAHVIPVRPNTAGKDTVAGFNVHSIALQIPTAHLVESKDQPVIGVYSTTYRRARRVFAMNDGSRPVSGGPWVQVSRLGNPLVNEVIIPLKDKDRFNASEPRDDAQFLRYVRNPAIAQALPALYPGVFDCFPTAPRNDLVTIFLTGIPGLNRVPGGTPHEALRLNTSIPPTPPMQQDRLGLLAGQLDGFPNGRRLIDDVTDIELRALAGATPLGECNGESPNNILGDAVSFNDKPRFFRGPQLRRFPYVVDPFQGFANEHQTVQTRALPLEPAGE